jgi:hypothetical protein
MTDDQLINFAMKQPVQVYSIQLGGTPVVANLLDLLSGVTGGRANLSSASSFQVEAMCNEFALAVKTQYLIGYKSTNTETNGHRRGVKVKVTPPDGSSKLSVWTVAGYYGPKAPKTKSPAAGENESFEKPSRCCCIRRGVACTHDRACMRSFKAARH